MHLLAQTPTDAPTELAELVEGTVDVAAAAIVIAAAAGIAFLLHLLVVNVVFRRLNFVGAGDRLARELRAHCRWPARLTTTLMGAQVGRRVAELSPEADGLVSQLITIAIIVVGAWWVIEAAEATEIAIRADSDLDRPDNRAARQAVTRAVILRRAATVLVVIVGSAAVLLTFDGARTIGASLLASAGILSIVAGVAAQSTLGNLVAGVQIAFAQSVRLDDVVVVDGEWGHVEAIGLTSIVVRTWDQRRLVMPTSWFTTTTFQNWSREESNQILGAIVWHLDPATDVEAMRTAFHERVQASEHWDGDVARLQVVDTTPTTIQVRGVASAANGEEAWLLRCELRERVLADLVTHQPTALPRTRLVEGEQPPT